MEAVKLGYVIPTMNLLPLLKQAIRSLPLKPVDTLVVVDNGSTDGTLEWLQEQRQHGRPIDVIAFGENRGVAAAWNKGLATVFGKGYVLAIVLNNDVVFAADTLEALVRGYNRYGGIVSAHSVAQMSALYQVDRNPTYGLPVNYSCFMLSCWTFRQIGPFDEAYWPAYFEDQDFDCRAEVLKVPRGILGDAVVCHFHSQTLQSGQLPDHTEQFEANRKRFMDKWQDHVRGRP